MSSELEKIHQISEGNQQAFRTLYEQYKEKVYNTVISYVQSVPDAEEITHDVFVSVYRNAKNFKGNSGIGTWIYRIAVNSSLNKLKQKARQQKRLGDLPERPMGDFEHPGIQLEKREQGKILFAAIYRLPENQKTAFILSYVEGLPRKEVAQIMETSLKSVEGMLMRAKTKLREILKNYRKE